jgi:hypothetical protein
MNLGGLIPGDFFSFPATGRVRSDIRNDAKTNPNPVKTDHAVLTADYDVHQGRPWQEYQTYDRPEPVLEGKTHHRLAIGEKPKHEKTDTRTKKHQDKKETTHGDTLLFRIEYMQG